MVVAQEIASGCVDFLLGNGENFDDSVGIDLGITDDFHSVLGVLDDESYVIIDFGRDKIQLGGCVYDALDVGFSVYLVDCGGSPG